ncbi:MAG: CorA family divalent cation transporter [Pirellulaceae bacterium]|jgi:hypothetical protein|nr:CorA family divalent cation transporter [Pirellulaceae bacterium]MDP7016135.1 CorA family divalent cation transporter [Pirellulaceae bacterium]
MVQQIRIPHNWNVPDSIRQRVADIAGAQRALEADGHLLLILHKLPDAESAQRDLRMFWRSAEGEWASNDFGPGVKSLQRHIGEYNDRVNALEDDEHRADSADEYFQIRREITPIHRAAKNMSESLSLAYQMFSDDRGLLGCRNFAAGVERTAELLKDDATYGLEFSMAKQAEAQALAGHRQNLITSIFFPILTFAAIFGMNLDHGLEHKPIWLFWILVMIGVSIGFMMKTLVFRAAID